MRLKRRLAILAIMWALTIALAMLAANTNSYMSLSTGSITASIIGAGQPAAGAGPVIFKTMTVGVCEKTQMSENYCRNEVMVVCGGEEYALPEGSKNATCGELKVDVPPVTGYTVFGKDWKDPRAS
ncbi:hypothetical protein HYV83_04800 [Candidatus Woesearchaeota archaeon]|nr:hypothetical protein [Candidatus Woesearchaeota archaeon]